LQCAQITTRSDGALEARLALDADVERLLWEKAWRAYGDTLSIVLGQALVGYRRTPGLDDLSRLYPSTVGRQALVILREELMLRWPNGHFGQSDLFVELRCRLRSHLTQYLLRRLVNDHVDTSVLRDALFGLDLGA